VLFVTYLGATHMGREWGDVCRGACFKHACLFAMCEECCDCISYKFL